MDYRAVITLAILNNVCHLNDAKLNVIPLHTDVKINDSTYMNCSTSLRADMVQWRHGEFYVYTGIDILEPYNDGRFSIEIDTSIGASNLVIRSVQPSDAGKYECLEDEGFGEKSTAELIVLDTGPVCKSNLNPEGLIGPNSCDVRAEEVKLSCSVKYYGNVLPMLQWKACGDNASVTEGLFNVTSSNNEATYSLTIKSELALDNSSFVCQTTRTTKIPYTCSSNTINILYVFSRKIVINVTMNDEVSCFANSSQSCSYKWKWFSGDDITTESDNSILKPKKVGWHRCEATCSFGNKSCKVESMQAMVFSDADADTDVVADTYTSANRQIWVPILALLLVLPLGVIGVIIHFWRKQKVEKQGLKDIGLNQADYEYYRILATEPQREPPLLDCLSTEQKLRVEEVLVPFYHIEFEEEIGAGNFGKVFRGRFFKPEDDAEEVAIKTILTNSVVEWREKVSFLEEAMLMKDFRHRNVLSLVAVAIENDFPYVVLPLMEHGDLRGFVSKPEKHLSVLDLTSYSLQIAEGMEYLAGNKFVHRDLAARNCMINREFVVKVADFGLARDIYQNDYYRTNDRNRPLPVKWMPIECLTGEAKFTECSDVWSFGVLMWELFTRGRKPYADIDNPEMKLCLIRGMRLEKPRYTPDFIYDLMRDCWKVAPTARPRFKALATRLREILYPATENIRDSVTSMESVDETVNSNQIRLQVRRDGPVSYLALSQDVPFAYFEQTQVDVDSNHDETQDSAVTQTYFDTMRQSLPPDY